MFHGLWRNLPEEVPITAITNGVHARSCVAKSTRVIRPLLGAELVISSSGEPDMERLDSG